MAAGLVHAVTRTCRQDNMTECGCDSRLQGGGSAGEGWHWGGCSDHIQYGTWFSRRFIDNAVKNMSAGRREHTLSTMNQHNSEVGRQVRTPHIHLQSGVQQLQLGGGGPDVTTASEETASLCCLISIISYLSSRPFTGRCPLTAVVMVFPAPVQ